MDGDNNIESWEITKTDSDSFNAKIVTNTNEARIVPQRMSQRLRGQISAEKWKAIGPGFGTDEYGGGTMYLTPQGFYFDLEIPTNTEPRMTDNNNQLPKLSAEIQLGDYDFNTELVDDMVGELKQQLSNAGYELEIIPVGRDIMLYIPI